MSAFFLFGHVLDIFSWWALKVRHSHLCGFHVWQLGKWCVVERRTWMHMVFVVWWEVKGRMGFRLHSCMFLIACFVGMLEHEDRGAGATDICGWFPSTLSILIDCFERLRVGAASNWSSSFQDGDAVECRGYVLLTSFVMCRADIWWSSPEPAFRLRAASPTSGVRKASGLCRFHFGICWPWTCIHIFIADALSECMHLCQDGRPLSI